MSDSNELSQSNNKADLPIFVKWMDFLKWLLVTLDGFPKKAKFTFAERMVSISLSILEDLVEARYSRNKSYALKKANLSLEKLRMFIRICYELKFFSRKSYEHASYSINEIGKMLGGWMKQQQRE